MSTFADLGLKSLIVQSLDELGFAQPTPIQAKTIPHLLTSQQDLIALAQTGTGKTAAFSLPVLHQLDPSADHVQALILCPTRELAVQVAEQIRTFVKYLQGISVLAVYGGERIDKQIREFKKKPSIVVGTPGRVNDLIRRRVLKVDQAGWLVLDEADEMLNMGFKEELDETLQSMPTEKQVLLFSATMNKEIRRIATNYMRKAHEIVVGDKNQGSDNVTHFYYAVHERDRYQALRRLADFNPDIHAIVFCRTRRETQEVTDKLIADHYSAEAIHGDVSQEARLHAMNRFKAKKVQLLVATDVAARGIDVDNLTHVINYSLPDSTEAYVHRSGRTGRANNTGISVVLINMREKHRIKALEKKIGQTFEHGRIPSGAEICEKQLFSLINRIATTEVNTEEIKGYLPAISQTFADLSKEEIISKFVSAEFNRFLEHYNNATDLNVRAQQDDGRGDRRDRQSQNQRSTSSYARFKLDAGRDSDLTIKDLFSFINSQPELKGVEIGTIDLQAKTTLIDIDERYKDTVLQVFSDISLDGDTPLHVTLEKTGISGSDSGRGGRGGRGNSSGGRRGNDSRGRGGFSGRRRSGTSRPGNTSGGGGYRGGRSSSDRRSSGGSSSRGRGGRSGRR